jgi:hypothetical protein
MYILPIINAHDIIQVYFDSTNTTYLTWRQLMIYFYDNDEIPSFDRMIKPLLNALEELGGTATVKEIDEKTIESMNPPEDMKTIKHKGSSNRTELEYRLAWARTYLKLYGWLNNESRGIWTFTDKYNRNSLDVDASDIVKSVKQGKKLNRFDSSILNSIDSAQAFEKLIISMLSEHGAILQKNVRDNNFDAILPNGIGDNKNELHCIIKYFGSKAKASAALTDSIIRDLLLLGNYVLNKNILIIVNFDVSEYIRNELMHALPSIIVKKILIWGREQWVEYLNPESDYIDYLINPRQALIEDSIFTKKSTEERNELKQENIDLLKKAYTNRDLVLIFGAGISIDSGVPLWSGLIKEMLIRLIEKKIKNKKLNNNEIDMLTQLTYDNINMSPLAQMRYIKLPFEEDIEEYYNLLKTVLYPNELKRNTNLLRGIAKISSPRRNNRGIKSIITYNFDDLIETALRNKDVEHNVVFYENSIATQEKLNIYHVHGYLPHVDVTQEHGNSLCIFRYT